MLEQINTLLNLYTFAAVFWILEKLKKKTPPQKLSWITNYNSMLIIQQTVEHTHNDKIKVYFYLRRSKITDVNLLNQSRILQKAKQDTVCYCKYNT